MNNPTITEVLDDNINMAMANLHTATIAKITKVNQKTINAKPVFNRVVDGESIELPEFAEIPVVHLHGGSSSIRMPIAVGDYCLLIFIERCIDDWVFGKDFADPREPRIHDYSDAVALVGLFNQSGSLDNVTTTTIIGDVNMTGNLNIIGNITTTGNISATGTITGTVDVIGGGISLKNHTHGGVQPGSGSTGAPQ